MALSEGHRKNFETLERAFKQGDIALMECTEASTGDKVAVICMVSGSTQDDESIQFIPVARMFKTDPYEEWLPPDNEEGTQEAGHEVGH